MKTRHWLDFAEYASLVGVGVGTIATFVSSQVLYTSAPLSLMMILNLANRRRADQINDQNSAIALNSLDLRLGKNIEELNRQVQGLPTPETLTSLKRSVLTKQRESLSQLTSALSGLQTQMQERLTSLEQQSSGNDRQDISQLQAQYSHLCDSVAHLTGQMQRLTPTERTDTLDRAIAQLQADTNQIRTNVQSLSDQVKPALTTLQDQISHLNRQFQKLPPPFDSSALKQEVAELIRVVAELVPKRDWTNLVSQMNALHTRIESYTQNEEVIRHRIQELNQQLQSRPVKSSLTSLQNQINHLNRQVQKLPPPFDTSTLKQEIAEIIQSVADKVPKREWSGLVAQVKALQQQQEFQAKLEETLRHELDQLSNQLKGVTGSAKAAESSKAPDISLQELLSPLVEMEPPQPQRDLQARIEDTIKRELAALQQFEPVSDEQLHAHVKGRVQQELLEINRNLRAFPSDPHYELVFDFKSGAPQTDEASQQEAAIASSRKVLEAAIAEAKEQLILIWPWSSQCQLDDRLMASLQGLLARGCQLDMGWYHPSERDERLLNGILQRWSTEARNTKLKTTLHQFLQLKQAYPDNFQFKILGTAENFLVCDRTFAVLGTDQALTTATSFPDLELKLRTTDAEVIQQLVERFERPTLNATDASAYWHRALTRYELGDRDGALRDFEHLLTLTPQDALLYNYRGIVHHEMGLADEALADFKRAIELDPKLVVAYFNRGFVHSSRNNHLAAIADYSLTIQHQPDLAMAYFFRGLACQKFGDPQGAVTDYSDAIRREPSAAPAYYYRGLIHQRVGEQTQAIADLEMAAHLFTQRGSRANAEKAIANLAKLRRSVAANSLKVAIPSATSNTVAAAPPATPTAETDALQPITLMEFFAAAQASDPDPQDERDEPLHTPFVDEDPTAPLIGGIEMLHQPYADENTFVDGEGDRDDSTQEGTLSDYFHQF